MAQTKISDFLPKNSLPDAKCIGELKDLVDVEKITEKCKFGSHMSIRSGFLQAAKNAKEKGYQSMQIFTRPPYGKNTGGFDFEDAKKANEFAKASNIQLFIHAPYIINLCRPITKENYYLQKVLLEEFRCGCVLGAKGIVIHVGKLNTKNGMIEKQQAFTNFKQHIELILTQAIKNNPKYSIANANFPMLLIETAAGQGTEMPVTMEDLAKLWNSIEPKYKEYIGFCVDTCHIFASKECDVSKKSKINEFVKRFNTLIGWHKVKLLHFNDSKFGFGCKKDRHARCGSGFIGTEGLHYMKKICACSGIPVVKEYA